MKQPHEAIWLLLAALLLAPPAATLRAQQIVQSGHGLDDNLRLGSGGYNSGVGGNVRGDMRLYAPGYTPYRRGAVGGTRDREVAFFKQRYGAGRPAADYRMPPPTESAVPAEVIVAGGSPAAAMPPANADGFPALAEDQIRLLSYGVGYYLGKKLRGELDRDGIQAELDFAVHGFRDGLMNNEPMLPEKQLDDILEAVHREMMKRMARRLVEEDPEFKKEYEANLAEATAFGKKFGAEEGVTTLPSGLEYKVIMAGAGGSPDSTDNVVLNVKVTLPNGKLVGQWHDLEVRVDETLPGGAELLPMMKLHAKWKAVFPPELAFGEGGRPPEIGPNQALVIEVELLEIKEGS